MGSWVKAGLLSIAFLGVGSSASLAQTVAAKPPIAAIGAKDDGACAQDLVDLVSQGKVTRFKIELADTPAKRAQGLMYREHMPEDAGMLFVYPGAGRAQFWMKNTLIALDMLFISPEGRVLKIHPMAEPLSEAVIDGGDGVKYVLEINGGLAKSLGLKAGAYLRHPALGPDAAWACK